MNLFDIDAAIAACVKLDGRDDYIDVSSGEIIDTAALDALKMEKEKKLRNIGCWILNLQAEKAAIKNLIKSYEARCKSLENKENSLKSYVGAFLNGEAWKCTECQYKWRETDSVVFNGDIKNVPKEYLRYKDPELDKVKVKKALKGGAEIPGCSIETKNSLSVKV